MKFLVDVNLPYKFPFFKGGDFLFVRDMDARMSDTDIWKLALENSYVLITRDADFYYRFLQASVSPKVVHIKLGNISLPELAIYFEGHWQKITILLEGHSFIVAERTGLEVIG
jgi:predicted nuclease of predicted toxin-antitoxin system